mgnify:CR=1 FL=1
MNKYKNRYKNAFNPCIDAPKVLDDMMKLSSLSVIDDSFDYLTEDEVQLINKDLRNEFGIDRGIKQWL